VVALLSAAAINSACAPLVLGGAMATGAVVVGSEHRGYTGFWSDAGIQSKIYEAWTNQSAAMVQNLTSTVNEGRVLLTGRAADAQMRLDAVRLASQPEGVKEVINEIQIDNQSSITDKARDTWVSTQLRTRLALDRSISSQNYFIDTVNGVVYLMGVARDNIELNRVIEFARSLSYVQRVVSYVRVG
jgi:osmotically-inducible protein OsmY